MHWEEDFRANMKRVRESLLITQTEMARRLKEYGLPFHQQTVQRVESGERPVRLDEAFAIAGVFGVPIEQMVRRDEGAVLESARSQLVRGRVAFRDAVEEYERTRARFAQLLDMVLPNGGDEADRLRAEFDLIDTPEVVLERWREANPGFASEVFHDPGYWHERFRNPGLLLGQAGNERQAEA